MKKLWGVLFFLLMASQAQAQIKKTYQRVKQAVTGSAKLAQLHYFPEQWELNLGVGYRYIALDIKGNSTGSTVVDAQQNQSILKGVMTLGVFSRVYGQLNWDYLVAMDTTYSRPTNQPSTKAKGVADPTFSGVVRLVDGDSVKLDLKGAFAPSFGDHNKADSKNEGDAKSGGHAFTFGGRLIALVTESSQLSASLDYRMYSLQNSIDQQTNEITEDDKHNAVLVELSTLTELTSNFYFGALLEIAQTEAYQSTNLTTQSKTDNGTISAKSLNVMGKYAFTPDTLVEVQAGYVIDYTSSVGTVDISATGYSLNANYLVRF